jgi:hypothetical protein
VLMERGSCMVLEQWFCGSASKSVPGTRAVGVW